MALLGERPTTKQILGGAIALAGLATIASTVGKGSSIPVTAMLFIILAAASWAYGNFTTRIAGPQAGFGSLAGVPAGYVASNFPQTLNPNQVDSTTV